MFRIVLLLLALAFSAAPAAAQNTTCANKPAADNSNACANTRYVTTAITNAYPNVWLKSVMGSGQNATANSFSAANQAMWMVGSLTGNGNGPYSIISVADTATNTTPSGFIRGLWVAHNVGASAGEGSRAAFAPILTIANPLPCTTGASCFHIAASPQTYITANLGGTLGTPRGAVYGAGAIAQLGSGATNILGVVGQETNVSVQSGASVAYKSIASFISVNSDAVGGTVSNSMIEFTADNTTTYKWPRGITFGRADSTWPFDSTSTFITTTAPGSGTRVGNWFLDGTNVTYTSGFIRSPGFSIGPSGAATVASLTSSGAVSGTTGTFTGALGASTITSSGAAGGLVVTSRSGSGNGFQWYNASGADIRLSNGADLVTMDGSGNITTGANVTNLHNYTTISVPTPSACGTSPSVDAGSTNHAGKVTFGSATTACTLTFASAYATNAFCTITPAAQPAAVANIPYISAQSKTAFTISGGTASASYYYTCGGN